MFISFAKLEKCSFITFSNKFSISCSSSSPSGTPMIQMLALFRCPRGFLYSTLFFFFLEFLFVLSILAECLFPLYISNHWFESQLSFPHCSLSADFSLFYLVTFISSFICCHTQWLLWAFWSPVFWTLHLIGWLSLSHVVFFWGFVLFFPLGYISLSPQFSSAPVSCMGWSLR